MLWCYHDVLNEGDTKIRFHEVRTSDGATIPPSRLPEVRTSDGADMLRDGLSQGQRRQLDYRVSEVVVGQVVGIRFRIDVCSTHCLVYSAFICFHSVSLRRRIGRRHKGGWKSCSIFLWRVRRAGVVLGTRVRRAGVVLGIIGGTKRFFCARR